MAMLKAREIRAKLQSKVDPVFIDILCSMAERLEVMHRQDIVLAEAYDRLVNMFTTIAAGAMKNKDNVDKVMSRMGVGDNQKSVVESISEKDDDTGAT